jgi:hypothetical protein
VSALGQKQHQGSKSVMHLTSGTIPGNYNGCQWGQAMKSNKFWEIVTRLSDDVEPLFWAILLAGAIYTIVFIIPTVSETQKQRERIRIGEIADENASICEKLDIKRGTDKHSQCLLDIGQFRHDVGKRIYDEFAQ